MSTVHRLIAILLFDQVDLLDVTGPAEVFSLLQREMDTPAGYEVLLVAPTMEPVTTSAGVRVLPDATPADLARRSVDTLIVPGAVTRDADRKITALVDPEIARHVADLAPRTRRVASVCVGAHVLAEAGLLDGRRATTHWSTAAQLAREHPEVTVDADPIFLRDGAVWTGAGLSACIDLTLALVAEDIGEEAAQRVARQLVVYLRRPGGQSQFSVPLRSEPRTRRIADLQQYIREHLAEDLTVPRLAEFLHVSDRQLTRVLRTELDTTPAAYVADVRLEAARTLLETTDDTLSRIAASCGFGTVDTLTRTFHRTLGVTPGDYRSRFRLK